MICRLARFADIPAIVRLFDEIHAASRYSTAPMSRDMAKSILMQAIMGDERNGPGSARVWVAETEAGIHGVLVGICGRLYEILDVCLVTDALWFVRRGGPALAAKKLAAALEAWARQQPGKVVLRQGVTSSIGDPERTGRLLERAGMARVGYIYEKDIKA